MRLFPLDFLSPLFQTYTPFGTHQNNATHRVFVLHYVCSIQFQRCMDINVYVHFRAQIEGIFCVPISCEIPRRYRDIVVKFHGPFAGSAPSCSWSESGRKLTTSVSPFLLLHDGCSRDYTSRPVCSTSSYTARHFVHICNCSLSESWYCSATILLCQVHATILSCCEVRDDIVGHDHMILALVRLLLLTYFSLISLPYCHKTRQHAR